MTNSNSGDYERPRHSKGEWCKRTYEVHSEMLWKDCPGKT